MDALVRLQRIRELTRPSLAARREERPLGIPRLNLGREREELVSLLVRPLLRVIGPEPLDDRNVRRVDPVRLVVALQSLGLVTRRGVKRAEPREHPGVGGKPRVQEVELLDRHGPVPHELAHVRELPSGLRVVRYDRDYLPEVHQSVLILLQSLVDQTQVVDRVHAVSLDAHGLQVTVPRALHISPLQHTVTLVHQRARVVPVALDAHVCVLLGVFKIPFRKVEERQVSRRPRLQRVLLLLELLQGPLALLEVCPAASQVGQRLLHLQLVREKLVPVRVHLLE